MSYDPVVREHQEWLGFLQPVGLVVSPTALKNAQARVARNVIREQEILLRHTHEAVDEDRDVTRRLNRFSEFAKEFWQWEEGDLAPPPDSLSTSLQEYGEILRPDFAVPGVKGEAEWQILIQELPASVSMDQGGQASDERSWQASPQARFERLLRDTGVPTGLLVNPHAIRLVYAPRGETAGHITFPVQAMCETAGRPIVAALHLLLDAQRLFSLGKDQRLPAILQASRKYQNEVSIQLAGQVLRALNELCRGFNEANRVTDGERKPGDLLSLTLKEAPEDVYGGLLTTLMRMVFLLYAEDRNLMASTKPGTSDTVETYQRFYGLLGLHEKLREDAAAYPDTMDQRFGAWAQFLTLSRLVHDGGGHRPWRLPARRGRLFDPDCYPFLEGRPYRSQRSRDEKITPPKISDGVLYRVLEDLLYLDGERISYRALDVEQIGSVYEAMMGFEVLQTKAPSIGFKPDHVVINLETLLVQAPGDRKKWIKEHLGWEPPEKASQALKSADNVDAILTALASKISPLYSDRERGNLLVHTSYIYLQPTEERRRSGSHYTPRSLTEPIVRTTLDPTLAQLGENPTPEQILNLKVCDPAMGSGAFLVEACRHLGDALVKAWAAHNQTPDIPTDQDPLLHARRIVAQRCLYGVDKNPFAVDLAKLSLWLATFAKDHPFTFLDHSFRHGDSLVGLSVEQMVDALAEKGTLFRAEAERQIANVMRARRALLEEVEHTEYSNLETHYANAVFAAQKLRDLGDLVVAAFFAGDKPKARAETRNQWINDYEAGNLDLVANAIHKLRKGLVPFHWHLEFPEVFHPSNGGFDSIVGNPPFLGGAKIWPTLGGAYADWLRFIHEQSGGKAVDLIAHFFRRSFLLLKSGAAFGLLATNTVAQGDTRQAGLRFICSNGGAIIAATRRLEWPGSAAVIASVIHIRKGPVKGAVLDGRPVLGINSYLFGLAAEFEPSPLKANTSMSFRGCDIYGQGFLFDDQDPQASSLAIMRKLTESDPHNRERIFPYIGGKELTTDPSHQHRRYAINFGSMSLEEAEQWPDLLDIVRARVKPTRDQLAGYSVAERRKAYWWQYGTYTPALYRAISGLEQVLAISQTTKYIVFGFLPTQMVYSHKLVVIPVRFGHREFCILQSRVHEIWALLNGSTMKDDPVYSTVDCFETFPFPLGWQSDIALEKAGSSYCRFRSELMVATKKGLTETYNSFHSRYDRSREVGELRQLHQEMDWAVLDAYGWGDLRPTADFQASNEFRESEKFGVELSPTWRYQWTDKFRDEVLARLLELNRQRAEEEKQAAAAAKPITPEKPRASKQTKKKPKATGAGQATFDLEPSE